MRVALVGRTEMLYETALLLIKNGHTVPVIVTAKEATEYKKGVEDFVALGEEIRAKVIVTSRINDEETIDKIKSAGPIDIGVSINYTNVISQEVIDLFPLGILNAHGGDLPRYRGNACQAWAILNGEDRIGLCIHKMIGGELDSGDIIEREYLPIDIDTKITEVYDWMRQRIPEMFLSAVRKLERDPGYVLEVQSKDPRDALRCYPRVPEDGRIDWSQSAEEILRLINASNKPYAGAFCEYEGKKLIVWDAGLYDDGENFLAVPGQVVAVEKEGDIVVTTGRGKLKIRKIEYDDDVTKPGKIIKSIRKRLK
jgi:UDP-4-amino-4-deoxy-L-arabinose formyltransferase/UDP-glucuronic acid dehydrogenase (UDP-4-keto-hexauronic acid decarboxylating)